MTHPATGAIAGRHLLDGPVEIATVSGIASTTAAMIDWFFRHTPVQIVTTKSIQLLPNPGNREPVITEPEPGSFGNAVGLRNPGMEISVGELTALRRRGGYGEYTSGALLNVSIAAEDAGGFSSLAAGVTAVADVIELNLSCPHAQGRYGSTIGVDPDLVAEVTAAAVTATHLPVFVKLTPNTDRIGEIARRAVEAGAAGITAINTTEPQQYRDPISGQIILSNPAPSHIDDPGLREAARGRGGRSGRWIRERALACIAEIRAAVGPDIPLIGMGGVSTHNDAVEMRAAGADIVGVGSALAQVHQRDWPAFLEEIRIGFPAHGDATPEGAITRRDTMLPTGTPGMNFTRHTVTARRELDVDGDGLSNWNSTGRSRFARDKHTFSGGPIRGKSPSPRRSLRRRPF